MGNEIAFRLSGGIFFNLILAARKKPLANQNECLRELLYIFDRSARGLSGNSLGTIASRFRNCDPKLHSDYIKFGDPVIVDEFNGRIQDDYDSVVNEVKHYADQYLDLKVNGRWLARSLMELVEKDDRIREKTEFLVLPGGFPVCKEEFRKMQMVHIYNLLLSVWHYICCTKGMAEDGQETYFALADFAGDSRPRKLDRSRIGFREHEDVKVSYDIEKDQTGRSGLKDRYMQMSVRGNFPSEKTDEYAGLSDRYRTYLSRAYEKHSRKKTFLYEMQRDFYGFFVCNDLKRREALCLGERKNEIRKDYVIRNADVDSFREEHRFIVLSGTGGMGKSMMMTHFMLDTIRKSKDTGEVPVIAMLRDYNPSAGSLLNFIFCELKRHDVKLQMSDLVELLQSGKGVILFDGLDEIRCENSRSFYKEMETLVDSYPAASYIVSSRPTMNFRGLSRFTVYDLQAFSQEQAVEMIEKLDQSVVDPVIKRDFVQDLKDNRFGFRHKERTEFLGNPLFLTIMLLTYEGNHDIPTERYLFYEQAYDAMAKKHDAAKALTREFETGLNSREFQNYFGEFCAITYEQEKYDFTPEEISGYFQEVIEANELETTPEAFIEDVTGKICLIYKDGGKYYFVHRSFQEYFVAYFFSRQLEQRFGAVLDILTVRDEMDHDSMVLPMLYGMEPEKTELCIFIPFLEKVFKGKEYVEQIFPFMGVRFIAINDNYDSRDYAGGIGEIDVAFKGILYDFYSEDLSEKIKSSFKIKKAQGQYIAALPPYGYVKDPKDKHKLIVDPDAAVIVKRIFREYLDGNSAYSIAQRLNGEGVETRSVYFERKFGYNCQGNREKALLWTAMSVIRVLDNENYIGTFVYHKYEQTEVASKKRRLLEPEDWSRIRNHHEALITEKDFAKVQKMRQSSKKERRVLTEHCLAGKLRCGLCGHRMRHSWTGRPKYECIHTYLNKGNSHERNAIIDADVERVVLSVLQKEIVIQGEAEKLADEKEKADQLKIEEAEKRMQAMQDSLDKLYADQMESFESYKAGITSRDVFMDQKVSYEQMEEQMQENIKKQRMAVLDLEKKLEDSGNGIRISGDQIKVDRLTREMVLMLIDRIIVWPGNRMEIKWNFKEK